MRGEYAIRSGPLRKIRGRTVLSGHYGCNLGAYTVSLRLECGHQEYRKGSQEPEFRARCAECGHPSTFTGSGA